ncbi:MAG: hypothetical protein Q4G43_17685 [Mobilicoccus sp.]|nr:hypothetical protein [Mobilicoccus sp.]
MATFTVDLDATCPPDEAWRRIWNLDAHSRVIPLTRLRGDGTGGGQLRPGSTFIARTGLGPLAVDDVMTVRRFDAPTGETPGHAHVDKSGRVVHGNIDATVEGSSRGSHLTWTQEIRLLGVPRLADPVVAVVARAAYSSVLKQLLARDGG